MFIDSHTHLEDPKFDNDRDEVIDRAKDAGVELFMNAGSDEESNLKILKLIDKYDSIYAMTGIHPHEADSFGENTVKELKEILKQGKVIAIGEIGLDYNKGLSKKENQIRAFETQLNVAKRAGLPVSIHSRDAHEDTFRILEDNFDRKIGGVMHCFSGDVNQARRAIELGLYISFAGFITYPNAKKSHEIIKQVPVDYMLIETDCPYLPPQNFRGKRNEPAHVVDVAEKIAEVSGLSVEDIARITSMNTRKVFGLMKGSGDRIVYNIRDSLYVNLTNECTNKCCYCPRTKNDRVVKGHELTLSHEPDVQEIIDAIGDTRKWKEVVFCGLGEPMLKLDVMIESAKILKRRGVYLRVNTNGTGNLIHGRNVVDEIVGLIDEVSVSLNAENEKKYYEICNPGYGVKTYSAVVEFIKECVKKIKKVRVTAVDIPQIDGAKLKDFVEKELGAEFHLRRYDHVG